MLSLCVCGCSIKDWRIFETSLIHRIFGGYMLLSVWQIKLFCRFYVMILFHEEAVQLMFSEAYFNITSYFWSYRLLVIVSARYVFSKCFFGWVSVFLHLCFSYRYLRSQVECLKCHTVSNTYDPFMDLSLEVHGSQISVCRVCLCLYTARIVKVLCSIVYDNIAFFSVDYWGCIKSFLCLGTIRTRTLQMCSLSHTCCCQKTFCSVFCSQLSCFAFETVFRFRTESGQKACVSSTSRHFSLACGFGARIESISLCPWLTTLHIRFYWWWWFLWFRCVTYRT